MSTRDSIAVAEASILFFFTCYRSLFIQFFLKKKKLNIIASEFILIKKKLTYRSNKCCMVYG